MIPPILIEVRFGWFWIPLPVVFLWPLLALAWLILGLALTVVAVGLISLGEIKPGAVGEIWITSWKLLCSLRGTVVDVESADIHLRVSIN